VLDDPRVFLNLFKADSLGRVDNKQLMVLSAFVFFAPLQSQLTFLMRSVASALTNAGTFISPRAIFLVVIAGASSKGASPTRSS
jgi:hypothetical protein